ncbi:aspartate/glutamate racemase family protein [Lutimaribacter marinistellae]|uniref:Aspartate/glutamate racemase family protein n=1 Tax=Lutimaribacter marinistellae TaxID=1820329 RepID=A0ABV7TGS2_9RHOB
MKVQGGKPVYGASVGILMLEARFPRIPGDMGNALTWDFPVQYRVVRNASPDLVVRQGATGLLPAFVDAARDLVASGVDGITTNCGFLSLFQEELSAAVNVPVAASSLMQVNLVNATLPPGKRCGILTISGTTLTEQHLRAANVPAGTPVGSTEGLREFTRAILGNELELDLEAARADNVDAAKALVTAHPDIGALVLECTNMVPYAPAIRAAVGLPVFSIQSFVNWFQSGLVPRSFPVPV